ncbi:MAG: hypothetical protein ACXAD7_27080 [Candidatus Kariarchaeaceae archaeon]
MKKYISPILTGLFLIFFIGGCEVGPLRDKGSKGGLQFDFDLAYPKSMGYNITQVHVTLTHQMTGTVVEDDLTVDTQNERASGTIRNLRVGTWDLLVELYEQGVIIGSGTTEVEIIAGVTTQAVIRISLDTGDLEIIVIWGFDFKPEKLVGTVAFADESGVLLITFPESESLYKISGSLIIGQNILNVSGNFDSQNGDLNAIAEGIVYDQQTQYTISGTFTPEDNFIGIIIRERDGSTATGAVSAINEKAGSSVRVFEGTLGYGDSVSGVGIWNAAIGDHRIISTWAIIDGVSCTDQGTGEGTVYEDNSFLSNEVLDNCGNQPNGYSVGIISDHSISGNWYVEGEEGKFYGEEYFINTVTGTLSYPGTDANGKTYYVAIDAAMDGSGDVGFISGSWGTGSTATYSTSSVLPGTYYVYAILDINGDGWAPPVTGDYAGSYGAISPPDPPNANVPSFGTVNFDITLDVVIAE